MQHNGVCARHFNPISTREDNELYFLERRFSRGSKVQSATTTRSLDLKIFVSREQTLRKGRQEAGDAFEPWIRMVAGAWPEVNRLGTWI